MDSTTLSWTIDEVGEVWQANYITACGALAKNGPIGPLSMQGVKRLKGKARSLADAQTRRQVRDADAWQRFTNARASRVPGSHPDVPRGRLAHKINPRIF